MDFTNIIIKPYHTEKSYGLRKAQDPSCLVFVVDKKATKETIKKAFNSIYNVMPEKINTVNRHPKKLRLTNSGFGYSKEFKLAYITLPKGMQIALTKDEIAEAAEENKAAEEQEAKVKKSSKSETEEK